MSSVSSSLQLLTENIKLIVTCCNKSRIRNFFTSQTLLHACFECDEFFCFGFPLLFLHWMLDALGTHHLKGRMQCTKALKPLSTHPQTYGKLGEPYSKTAFQLSLKQMKKLVLNCKQTNKKKEIKEEWFKKLPGLVKSYNIYHMPVYFKTKKICVLMWCTDFT